MSESLTGGCLCGALRYRLQGPYHLTHCHCRICRRASAAAFVSWLSVRREDFALLAGAPVWYRSTPQAERGFCGQCGSQLLFRSGSEELDVTICSLDQPEALQPEDHTWTRRQLPWIQLADGLPRHPQARPDNNQEPGA